MPPMPRGGRMRGSDVAGAASLPDGFYWIRVDEGRGTVGEWTVGEQRGGLWYAVGEDGPVYIAVVGEHVAAQREWAQREADRTARMRSVLTRAAGEGG